MVGRWSTALGAAVILASGAPVAAADASGRFVVQGGGAIAPKYAAAFETRDTRNPRVKVVEVVLSELPIDAEAAAAALSPHAQVINQDALSKHDYILLWVRPDGNVSMNATFGTSMSQYLDTVGQGLTAQLSENSADKVAGRISTAAPVKVMSGESYTLDVTFSTSVTRVAPGTALPAGGGDPGKALKALDLAVTERTWPGIRTALTAKRLESFDKSYNTPEENLDYAVAILRAWLPKKGLVVVGGELRGDTAILEVEGEAFPGSKGFYVARMSKAGTAWLFDTATMVGLLP